MKYQFRHRKQSQLITRGGPTLNWCAGAILIGTALSWLGTVSSARAACQQGCDVDNENTFLGDDALVSNTTGILDTAVGDGALSNNTTGFSNTALGSFALALNNDGEVNTASGAGALFFNTTGSHNTANGGSALFNNTTGASNTAIGNDALFNNTTGGSNIALGNAAGINLTTGTNNIYIGNAGLSSGESSKIRIGTVGMQTRTFIAGISRVNVPDGVGVIVGSDGKLGTVVSSARFKDDIKAMDKASEVILALKPVTFHYKKELDPEGIPQFGLVAEDIEKENPDLVARDDEGRPYTVRYEAVNAMLLNEFLKAHRKMEEQEVTIVQLKKDFQATATHQQKQIEALTAGLQKVSAELELSKRAPRTVLNNQ
jgi:Chaperone of endosialidase